MRFLGVGCLAVAAFVVCPSIAFAQDAPPPVVVQAPSATPVLQPAPPPPPPTSVDPGTFEDANAGRNWLSPTALTPPGGTWSFSDYELLLVGASYAVTDKFLLSVTSMIPIDGAFFAFASAKLQLLKAGPLRFAIQGSFALVSANTSVDSNGNTTSSTSTGGGGLIGGALTYCADSGCFTHLDAYVGAAFDYQTNPVVPVAFAGALTARIARHVRLLLEVDSAGLLGNDISGVADGVLAWYGLRFTSKQIGVDVGLVEPVCSGCSNSVFPIGFPVVTFTYRGID
jgi:hypothetical protein